MSELSILVSSHDTMPVRHMLWPCVCLSVRSSVCPSVTSWYSIKTAKDVIMQYDANNITTYMVAN